MLNQIKKELTKYSKKNKAKDLARFFKTHKGGYGEGDIFIGVAVPDQRKVAGQFLELSLVEARKLLNSPIHEHRLTALIILSKQFKRGNDEKRKKIYDLYVKNYKAINNWDLVDLSAITIMGDYLIDRDKSILYKWAKSKNIWQRRMAVLATFEFIRRKKYNDTLKLCEILLKDDHDLIHKATGWALREIGNRNLNVEEEFLLKHYKVMPRTMLRYAIEKFSPVKRKFYLAK